MSENNHPPFDAPWQAEAFALVVALNEAGHLRWSDWAEVFSRQLAATRLDDEETGSILPAGGGDGGRDDGDEARNTRYWRAWRLALESICHEREWAGPLQLVAHQEAVRAYRRRLPVGAMFSGGTTDENGTAGI